jgi:hypothetical protein
MTWKAVIGVVAVSAVIRLVFVMFLRALNLTTPRVPSAIVVPLFSDTAVFAAMVKLRSWPFSRRPW